MAAQPLGAWKLLLGLGHEVKYECGLAQANATETAVQAQDKQWATSANH